MNPTSVLLLLDLLVKVAPSVVALVDAVRDGHAITQADIDAATAAAHQAADGWDAAAGAEPEAPRE